MLQTLNLKQPEQRLRRLFTELTPADQATLLAFAEFLQACSAEQRAAEAPAQIPELLPRPPTESVVGAIKRLSASYPMLDRAHLLNETSALMTQHIIAGRGAVEVINELEQIFAAHYQKYQANHPG